MWSQPLQSLPSDLWQTIRSDWVEVEDLVVFDSALCSHNFRPLFLSLCQDKGFILAVPPLRMNNSFFQWVIKHSIKLNRVWVSGGEILTNLPLSLLYDTRPR